MSAQEGQSNPVRFSIVVATRNRPGLLPRALKSVNCQTFRDFETLVVDDNSDSPVVLSASAPPGTILLRCPSQFGAAGAKNLGAENARGKWIVFLDDDDEWEPQLLERTAERLDTAPDADFCWSGIRLVHYFKDGRISKIVEAPFPERFENEERLLITASEIGAGYALAVRREKFLALSGFDRDFRTIEDTEFIFRLLSAGSRPTYVPSCLVTVHNHHEPRLTQSVDLHRKAEEYLSLREAHATLLERYPGLLANWQRTKDIFLQRAGQQASA